MASEYLLQIWEWASAWNVAEIVAGAIVVTAIFEKVLGVDFVGVKIFRLIGRVIKFLAKRIAGPELEKAKQIIIAPARIEEKLQELDAKSIERDARRVEDHAKLSESVAKIEKENTLNGGDSMKDVVVRLLRHDEQKWGLLTNLNRTYSRIQLRLDILDAGDNRMDFDLSPDMKCTRISPRFLRYFGYTEHDMLGSDWEFCISERSLADVRFRWERATAKHVEYRKDDQYIVDSDGKEHLCLVRGYPVFDDEGQFDGFYGTVEVLNVAAGI